MKIGRYAAYAAAAAALLLPSGSAQAQFAGFTGNARTQAAANTASAAFYGNISFYPFAAFANAGRGIAQSGGVSQSGTSTTFGVLTSANVGFKPKGTRAAFEIGGWYWNNGPSDLYQINLRAFPWDTFGFQVGYIASTVVPGNAETYSLVYDINSKRVQPNARKPWQVEVGLGMFVDNSTNTATGQPDATASLTFFLQASFEIAKHISLTASDWYVRDRGADDNRFALGLGYSF